MASLAVPGVLEAVWALDSALAVVSEVVATVVATVVGDDVAAAMGGSGRKRRGWGLGCEGVGWSGNWSWHSQGAGGCFGAGDGVVVVVVNSVGSFDGACAGIVSSDVAALGVRGRLVTGAVGAGGSSSVCMALSQVLGCSIDVPTSFSRRGGPLLSAVCITTSTVEVGMVWVLVSIVTLVSGSVCVPSSTSSLSRFVSHFSCSAILPLSSPSFSPLS
jgi:hypothetical protein